jgi:DNA integrity scanning protein DisA with diadenylate cyclase activity
MAAAALIIVVVFRNEIRNILQARNLHSILWGLPQRSVGIPVEILAESAFEMARRRIGAIIVLPGKEDLQGVLQGGIPWRGLITREMIQSIFWPGNPVHDGAAVLQGDRIARVAALLPLSSRTDLPSGYGTRHRAALGLTESTDALAVVVSEQRGAVVVASGGDLHSVAAADELAARLRDHLGLRGVERRRRERERLRMGAAALTCLLFVTAIWVSVSQGLDALVTLDIPVEYMKRQAALEIVETSADTVRLTLGGSGALIKAMRPQQVSVRVDLQHAAAGRNTFSLTSENVALPPGVVLKRLEPAAVEVALDETVRRWLPIQSDWEGRLPGHLVMSAVRLEPETLEVVGGRRLLDRIDTLYTEKIPLGEIRRSGSVSVGLAARQEMALRIPSGADQKITVHYTVKTRGG